VKNYNENVSRDELQIRVKNLQKAICEKDISGAVIYQNTDLVYFTGTSFKGWLYIPSQGKPILAVFNDLSRVKQESPLDNIVDARSIDEIPDIISRFGYLQPNVLGLECDVLPTNLYFKFQNIFKNIEFVDISTEIRLIRAIKSKYEIRKIKAAAALSDKVAERAAELLMAGKTEVTLSGELESYARSLGHQGLVRMRLWGAEMHFGHLMSGASAAIPSYLASPTGGQGVSPTIGQGAGYNTIGKNEPVIIDYVFALDGYLSDHTRIFSIGPISNELQEAHHAMLTIQEMVKKEAKPGVETGTLYEMMVSLAEKLGYGDSFMGVGDRKIRFTGHGVGLELDEYPFIAKGQSVKLKTGMVIALEPKAIFPGKGVVGIENTHVCTDNGLETLGIFSDEITIIT
jgi:Xaa-Pro aminopeptidase